MLIDHTFFTRPPRRIKSLTLGEAIDPNARKVKEFIQSYINHYEPVFLEEMFGFGSEVSRYAHEKDRSASVNDPTLELLCDFLKEPCADYIYYCILRDTVSETTIEGEVKDKITEGSYVSPISKQVQAWNDMARRNRNLQNWIDRQERLRGIEIDPNMLTPINRFNL